jgi:methionyl-tRNA formyltransferase
MSNEQLCVLLCTGESATHKDIVVDILKMYGDLVIETNAHVTKSFISENKVDFVVSDRYSFVLESEVLQLVDYRAINTHPSLLPANRGWQPIFFSLVNGGPVGVTIHRIDEGLDTGAALAQQQVDFQWEDSLRVVHLKCRLAILHLLAENWKTWRTGKFDTLRNEYPGSYHSKFEFELKFALLENGWDSTAASVKELGAQAQS